MKKMICLMAVCGLLTAGVSAFAQGPQMPDFDFAKGFIKLFGKETAFSAKMSIKIVGGEEDGTAMTSDYALLEGKTRMEMNMAKIKSKRMPANAIAQMQAMGMDKIIVISRPDKKVTYQVYPGMKSYVTQPIKTSDAGNNKEPKIEKTELGKETIDGHPCVKNKVVITTDDGELQEFIAWNATDLDNLMIQVQHAKDNATITMKFTDVKKGKPEAKLFEPSADFTPYNSMMDMMMKEMMKRGGGQ